MAQKLCFLSSVKTSCEIRNDFSFSKLRTNDQTSAGAKIRGKRIHSNRHQFTQDPGKSEMFYLYKDPLLAGEAAISEEELQLASLSIWMSNFISYAAEFSGQRL